MSTLYISGYSAGAIAGSQVVSTPTVDEQTVPIGGTSTQSNAFGEATRIIRVHTDVACSIAIGPNPIATTANMRLAANQTECFSVQPGHRLAVIANV